MLSASAFLQRIYGVEECSSHLTHGHYILRDCNAQGDLIVLSQICSTFVLPLRQPGKDTKKRPVHLY